ncbi:hypothetical protein EHS25_002183 [Saitozyma podzolica]|uniref:Uncharacterized protein n=1 Tax=Saitozyma podzolica TaxID=1890683 RepID=A0A427YEW6_9TREE|nr:hypothetical protein EHS25_002183 [Saitozyma podzolica]
MSSRSTPARSLRSLVSLLPVLALGLLNTASAQYTATYYYGSQPAITEQGQTGTNQCGTTSSQTSECQNAFINSVEDFCVWGPPSTTSNEGDGTSKIGNVEQIVVSYCTKDGYGTRLIPSGTLTGAHFVKVVSDTVSYVQVTGTGDHALAGLTMTQFTKINIPAGDDGGELDPHSWTGLGNPKAFAVSSGLVFTNAFTGNFEQTHEWTSFMSPTDFCFRACRDGNNAAAYCEHIYDTLGCAFTIPGSMGSGFDDCLGDPTSEAPGVYSGSTFQQGDPTTPAAHPAGATSQCTTYATVSGGDANAAVVTTSTSASASASASASVSASSSVSITSASGSVSSSASGSVSGSVSSSASASGPSSTSSGMITSKTGSGTTPAPSGTAANAASASATTSKSSAEGSRIGTGAHPAGLVLGAMAVGAGALLL